MKLKNSHISNEFILQRWGNGIKLVRPSADKSEQTLENILKSKFNVYLYNTESHFELANDAHTISLNFASTESYLGKSIRDLVTKKCADQLININKEVMENSARKIIEEDVEVGDQDIVNCLSIKLPWYSTANKIIGIFGVAIALESQSLSDSLTQISDFGLMDINNYIGKEINNVYLSKRQNEVLNYVVRGKTIRETARIMGLSPRTVGHYFEMIKNKMNAYSKSELIDKAFNYYI